VCFWATLRHIKAIVVLTFRLVVLSSLAMLFLMSSRFPLPATTLSRLLLIFYETTIWIYLCLALLTMQQFRRRSLHLRMLSSCLLHRLLVLLVLVGAVLYPHQPLLRAPLVLVGAVQYPHQTLTPIIPLYTFNLFPASCRLQKPTNIKCSNQNSHNKYYMKLQFSARKPPK